MRDDIDIEGALKRFEGTPGPEVRRSVLARFSRRLGGRGPESHETAFWKRPVPLYVAAAGVVVAVCLSFFAGQRTAVSREAAGTLREPARALNAGVAPEIEWEAAPNDLL